VVCFSVASLRHRILFLPKVQFDTIDSIFTTRAVFPLDGTESFHFWQYGLWSIDPRPSVCESRGNWAKYSYVVFLVHPKSGIQASAGGWMQRG